MDVSIIILSYNTRELLQRCLIETISHRHGLECEIIVVDNASHDGSVEMVRNEFPEVKVIENTSNIGYASGNNLGINASQGEFILLLNSDAFLSGKVLLDLVKYFKNNHRAGIVGPRLIHGDGSLHLSCRHFPSFIRHFAKVTGLYRIVPFRSLREWDWMCDFAHDQELRVDMLSGACWMLRRSMLNEIGFLNEDLFLYGEEFDLCWRAAKAGWETWFVLTDPVTHLGGKSTQAANMCMGISFHRYRSDYLNLYRHYGRAYWFCIYGLDQMSLTWRYWKARFLNKHNKPMVQGLLDSLKNSQKAGREMMRLTNEPRKTTQG